MVSVAVARLTAISDPDPRGFGPIQYARRDRASSSNLNRLSHSGIFHEKAWLLRSLGFVELDDHA